MPEYWEALRAQDLVLADPHLVLQGEEHCRPTTHVPAQIQTYWDKINRMVEARDGHLGVEFPEMSIVK